MWLLLIASTTRMVTGHTSEGALRGPYVTPLQENTSAMG